jgi:hypothetical protein
MYMVSLSTRFNIPGYHDSFTIAIKPKTNYKFHAAATLLFILFKRNTITETKYFTKITYHILFQDPVNGITSILNNNKRAHLV